MRHNGKVDPAPRGLIAAGPLVKVLVRPVGTTGADRPVLLMVDTGAQRTCVNDAVIAGFGLAPIRFDPIVGVSGKPENMPVYRMDIVLTMENDHGDVAHFAFRSDIVGTPSAPGAQQHQGLIGRDFLARFRFQYDGPSATFSIVDPSPPPHVEPNRARALAERESRQKARAERKAAKRRR